jgi:3-hydroxyisobutyrate dehydrogenase
MNIALLGTGLMGQALVEHLLAEGQSVTVYNRTAEKVVELQQNGALVTDTAQEALLNNDICILMLSDAGAIHAVLDSIDKEAFKDKLIIQMGTIAPNESRSLQHYISERQGRYLECPVLGSLPEARSGTLILMAGGSAEDYNAASPLLQFMGKDPRHIGEIGQGATVKLAMNQLIAGLKLCFKSSLGRKRRY